MASTYRLSIGDEVHEVEVDERDGRFTLRIDGEDVPVDLRTAGAGPASLLLDGDSFEVVATEQEEGYEVLVGHHLFDVVVERPNLSNGAAAPGEEGAAHPPAHVRTPLTGVVVDVRVEAGTEVTKGQTLVVVESMKMNNELRAPRDGTVGQVHVQQGDRVERNTTLVTIR
jgi:biotin carboxyl carrier protein